MGILLSATLVVLHMWMYQMKYMHQYKSEMVILFLSLAFLNVTYTYHIEIFAVNIVCDLRYKGFADLKFAVYWFSSRQVEMESK